MEVQRPPIGFSERKVVEQFNELILAGSGELALDLLIKSLPALAASKLNRKEKHNHLLFMSLILQNSTNGKHGFRKLLRKVSAANEHIEGLVVPPGSTFLDFGCGAHDPIAVASYYYLNGYNRAIACDLLQPRNPVYSALSMYDILANIAVFPDRYKMPGTDSASFADRYSHFPTAQFQAGDFGYGLDQLVGKVDLRIQSLLDLDVEDRELGFAVSFAVLEHVEDPKAIAEWLFRKSRPGGVQYHFIDMADHRSYSPGAGFNPWSFLTEETAKNANRVRKSEFVRIIRDVGFEIVSCKATESDVPDEIYKNLAPRWRELTDEDLRTTKLHITIRRPA
jgi:hypothetical protein